MMSIYVGSLSYGASEAGVRTLFEEFGQVDSVKIIKDALTGKSRGFAFVTMPNPNEAKAAITGLNGKNFEGLNLRVNEATPREQRPQTRNNYR